MNLISAVRIRVLVCLAALACWSIPTEAQSVELVGQLTPAPATAYADVWGEGDFAYLATQNNGVFIIDISDPAAPQLASHYRPGRNFQDVKVDNGIGYFGGYSGTGVDIVDLTDPYSPSLLSQVNSANGGFNNTHNVSVGGNFLYLTSGNLSDVRVFDISTPTSPQFLWQIDNFTDVHDMTAVGDRLYTSGWNGRTEIFDVSAMTATQPPILLGSIASGSATHSSWPTADHHVLATARECAGLTCGVALWDISDPANSAPLSRIGPADIGAPATVAHNPLIKGDYLYVSWYATGLQVFDISDPVNRVRVGNYDTFEGMGAGFVGNWGVYPFLGTDRVLLSDMRSGLIVVDVSSVVPEPAGCLLVILGLLGITRRRL